MIKKLIFSSLMCLCLVPGAWAADTSAGFSLWQGKEKYALQKNTIKISMAHAVGLVAVQKVEHGGYFCPVDFACETYDTSALKNVWISWYYTDEASRSKCTWLCADGYTGVGCKINADNGDYALCDTNNLTEWWSGITGGKTSNRNDVVHAKDKKIHPSGHYVWGLVELGDHSATMKMVRVQCKKRDAGGGRYETKFDGFFDEGSEKLLCAQGFKAENGSCVPIGQTCMAASGNFCSEYPESGYDSSIHTLQMGTGTNSNCVEYRCIGEKENGFPASGGFTCSACSELGDPRGGVDAKGRCKVCETGEYFNKQEYRCATVSNKYTKTDLVYGKGKVKTSEEKVSYQCWVENSPDDYSECVETPSTYKTKKMQKNQN